MEPTDEQDRLLDVLLHEELGGETPPNLTARVLRAADAGGTPAVRRWPRRLAVAATLALAALGGALGYSCLRGGYAEPPPRGTEITTGDGPWRVRLGQGGYCRMQVAASSRLRIGGRDLAEEVFLEAGELACEVDSGVGSFTVKTEAGEVAVRGTKFSVRMVEPTTTAAQEGGDDMGKRMVVRVAMGAVLMSGLWGSTPLAAGEEGGTVTGVLASKGDTWIGIRAEGQDDATLYLPHWKGGLPKDGGGFDKEMLGQIKGLVVGSKVKLAWKAVEDHPRIVGVEVLALPEKPAEPAIVAKPEDPGEGEKVAEARVKHPDGEKVAEARIKHGEGEGDGPRVKHPLPEGRKVSEAPVRHGDGDRPRPEMEPKARGEGGDYTGPKQGTAVGQVTGKREAAIEVKETGKDTAELYMAQWKGGLPKDGGSLDRDIMKQIMKVKVGDWVKIDWVWDHRRRITKMTVAGH